MEQIVTLFNQRLYVEVESLARKMTERYPNHGFGWKVLGAVYKEQNDTLKSLKPSQKAAALLPLDAEAHYNLGNTLMDLGRLDEAEAIYRRALRIKPDFVEAHNNLGITLKDLGRLDEAEASSAELIRIKPDYAEAHSIWEIPSRIWGAWTRRKPVTAEPCGSSRIMRRRTTIWELP